jgi:hypothetical protein
MNTMTHPLFGDVNYSTSLMSCNPDAQVEQAIRQMAAYSVADSQTPLIQEEAARATRDAGDDPIKGAYQLARKRIRFTEDRNVITTPGVVEVLIRPIDVSLLDGRIGPGGVVGDCDDFSMFVAALLLAQGVPCCFATVGADAENPSVYSHVYVVAYTQNGRVAIDASHGKFCGWEAPNRYGKFREWDVVEYSSGSCAGSGSDGVGTLLLFGAMLFGAWYLTQYGWPSSLSEAFLND